MQSLMQILHRRARFLVIVFYVVLYKIDLLSFAVAPFLLTTVGGVVSLTFGDFWEFPKLMAIIVGSN